MNALQAGVMNVPFAPVRGLLHTDYMKVRPDFRTIANPYDPAEEIALVPAIAPDVAVFHGFRGDRFGNVVTSGTIDAKLIAQASRVTLASVEQVVDGDLAREPHTGALVSGMHVRAAAADETFRAYLERYVLGTRDHRAYLALVAEARVAAAGRA